MTDDPTQASVNDAQPPAPPTEDPPYPSERYAWYVVAILMIVYVFSFVDRQILSLLVGPIKEDLNINDTQMSYLMGFSFALFYTIFGIPLGRLADSKSRRTIIACGLAVWSFMSAGSGLAKTYTHLLFMRVGVGVGEAALSPSAYSLISDYFRPKRLALAISVYGTGIYIGAGMAYLLGGYVVEFATVNDAFALPIVGEIRPWQLVFFAIGIPGLFFAAVLYTIKEPLRRGMAHKSGGAVPMSEAVDYLKANRKTFFCHTVGFALLSFISYGSGAWIPTFFVRIHGWTASQIGVRYGIVVMIVGTLGIMSGGYFAEKLAARGYRDSKMRVGLIAAILHVPLGLLFPLMPSGWLAFAVLVPSVYMMSMPFGVAPAAIQEMMPNQLRGQASAFYLFVINLIGLGMGPTAVALCTDQLFADDNKIHLSLLLVSSIAGLFSILLLASGLKPFRNSLTHRDEWIAENS